MTDSHDIVRRWLALWNGDLTQLEGLVAEDAVTHAVLIGQEAETPMEGRDALGGWIAQLRSTVPALRFAIEVGPLIDGELIALRWRATGPHGAARIDFAGTDILRVADGLIAEYWLNSDTSLMMAQMQAGAPTS